MKVKSLVCYHRNAPRFSSDTLVPIHAGRALASRQVQNELSDMIGDDTGDNISHKNANFCELTALYWMWKNLEVLGNPEYVGLFHYRRFLGSGIGGDLLIRTAVLGRRIRNVLVKKNTFLEHDPRVAPDEVRLHGPKVFLGSNTLNLFGSIDRMLVRMDKAYNKLCERFDIIVPEPTHIPFRNYRSSYLHYGASHLLRDMDRTIELVRTRSPEMFESLERILCLQHYCEGNVFIMRTDIFKRFAEWLFDILFTLEAETDLSEPFYNPYQARIFGFLSERLLTTFAAYWESRNPVGVGRLRLYRFKSI